MANSVVRKSTLLQTSKTLLNEITENDTRIKQSITQLNKSRNDNSQLAFSLHSHNSESFKTLRQCEILENFNKSCEETANVYKSILAAYEQQSGSIQTLYQQLISK